MSMARMEIARTILLTMLTCCAVVVLASVPRNETGNTATKKPAGKFDRMFPDGTEHDFGRVDIGTQCKHAFRIVNTSGVPLRILSIRVS